MRKFFSIAVSVVFIAGLASHAPRTALAIDYPTYISGTSPVGWWGMNETGAPTATADLSGAYGAANNQAGANLPETYQNPGTNTLTDQPGFVVSGAGNSSAYFDGTAASNAYAHATGPYSLALPGAIYRYENGFSVEAWVKTDGPVVTDSERVLGVREWSLGFEAKQGADFGYLHFTTFGKQDYFSTTLMPSDNAWHQVGVSWDGSTSTASFYIDGSFAGSQTAAADKLGLTPINNTSPNNQLNLASRASTSTQNFKGWLDEVVIWDKTRTDADFDASYKAGAPVTPPPTTFNGVGTWEGTTSSSWNDSTNWQTNFAGVPGINTPTPGTAKFDITGSGATTVTLEATDNPVLKALSFSGTNYTISGGSLTMDKGSLSNASITVNHDGTTNISSTITVAENSRLAITVANVADSLTLSGPLTRLGADNVLSVKGSGTTTISGCISGEGSIDVYGTLVLSNTANTYTSGIYINGGVVKISGSGNLGSGGEFNKIGLDGNGKLQSTGNTYDLGVNRSILVGGSGTIKTIQVDAGSMTVSGSVDIGEQNGDYVRLAVTGAGKTVISGDISGAGGLDVNGGGTLVLSGSNSYYAGTSVTDGILAVTTSDSLPDNYSLIVGAGGTLIFAPASTFGGAVVAGTVTTAGAVSAVPEPSTFALLFAGLVVGFGLLRKRK